MSKRDNQSIVTRTLRRIKVFFGRINRREVLTFLMFLLISAFFWAIKSASEENDVSYDVQLVIKNVPSDIVFTSQVPKQVKVSIKDKNINLLSYSHEDIDSIFVDFNIYNDAFGNFRISGAELQALLINELYPSTQITSVVPSLIEAKFAVTEGKMVPVVFNSEFTTASNYRSHSPVLIPDSVIVHAPNNILDTITMVQTERYVAYNLTDTLEIILPLNLEVGVKSTPDKINILVPISQYVEKVFQNVTINVVDVPANKTLSIFPNKAKLSCLVDLDYFTQIPEEDFYLSVSYNSITSDKMQRIPVDVISYTNNNIVSNIKLQTPEVEYIIENK